MNFLTEEKHNAVNQALRMPVNDLCAVDSDKLFEIYKTIEGQEWYHSRQGSQLAIQVHPNALEDTLSPCGSARTLEFPECEYSELHRQYRGTYLEQLILDFPFRLSRMRWVILGAKSCYSVHSDQFRRIQIPVRTSDESFLLFMDPLFKYSLVKDRIALADATKFHTALNTGDSLRVHIVANAHFS